MPFKANKTPILAIETSGRMGSIAVGKGGPVLAHIDFSGPMRHSSELFPSVEKALNQIGATIRQVQQVYVSAGPGSFTGLRLAITMAKMINLANGAKTTAVSTTEALAENATAFIEAKGIKINRLATILDAKRKQFYTAVFQRENKKWVKTIPDCLMQSSEFIQHFSGQKEPIWLLGEGLVYYKDKFKADGIEFIPQEYWPAKASNVYNIGLQMAEKNLFANPVTLVPLYLRCPEAIENRRKDKSNHS